MSADQTRALIAEADKHVEIVRCGNPRHTNFAAGCPDCGTFCEWCDDEWPCLPRRLADALSALPVPDGDARERLIHLLFEQVPEDWDENDIGILADAILAAFPVLSRAAASEPAIERVRALHRRSYAVFSWKTGPRYEDPCPDCDGKAGVHPCGCWADIDTEYVCSECKVGQKGASVPWPCPTIQALEPLPVGGESDGK